VTSQISTPLQFTKMHGIGNDFVIVDDRDSRLSEDLLPALSRLLNDRRFGVGGDGLILLRPAKEAGNDYAMRMLNPDGSEAEMCGNGIRCLAKFAFEGGVCGSLSPKVETASGTLELELGITDNRVESVTVEMGQARWRRRDIPVTGPPEDSFIAQPVDLLGRTFIVTAVSMGNPHAVVPVIDAGHVPLHEWGPALETAPIFPQRINVHFLQTVSRWEIVQRTWERGAGATLACGSGACACVAVGHKLGLVERDVTVHLPGGDLHVEVVGDFHMRMTGPAEAVFTGTIEPAFLESKLQ
jgi:diaminopimelate epimerase